MGRKGAVVSSFLDNEQGAMSKASFWFWSMLCTCGPEMKIGVETEVDKR